MKRFWDDHAALFKIRISRSRNVLLGQIKKYIYQFLGPACLLFRRCFLFLNLFISIFYFFILFSSFFDIYNEFASGEFDGRESIENRPSISQWFANCWRDSSNIHCTMHIHTYSISKHYNWSPEEECRFYFAKFMISILLEYPPSWNIIRHLGKEKREEKKGPPPSFFPGFFKKPGRETVFFLLGLTLLLQWTGELHAVRNAT